jgi:hypothetical protein
LTKKRKRYSAQFKFQIALEAVKGLKTVNQLARLLNKYIQPKWHFLAIATLILLIIAISVFLVFWAMQVPPVPEEGLAVGTLVGLCFGLIFGIEPKDGRRRLVNDIQAESVDKLSFSWQRTLKYSWIGVLFGALSGFIVAISDKGQNSGNPLTEFPTRFGLSGFLAVLVIIILAALVCGAVVAIVAGLTGSVIDPRSRSCANQGILLSFKNAGVIGLVSGLLFAIFFGSLGGLPFVFYGLFIGFLMFLWFGGLNIYLHYSLRLFLWGLGLTPFPARYGKFLNSCTDLGFLQHIYRGYQFSHRFWQEYFSKLQ